MNFYISPENRIACEKKINKILSGLTVKPNVTFSEKTKVVKTTVITDGEGNHEFRYEKLSAIFVEIEDIKVSEWVLVATVDYKNNALLMGDSKLFKNIPEGFGLEYIKCDHCGSVHKSRTESHILYNTLTEKWMQVGSTCVNKLINGGKYLNKLMLKLYDVIRFFDGCREEDFGPKWRPSNKWVTEAIPFKRAIAICNKYMTEVSNVWTKAERWHGEKTTDGTNDKLMSFYHTNDIEDNEELFNNVKAYFDGLEYGEVLDYEKSLTQKIKDAFEDEFIMLYEMYLPWFAIDIYNKSLTKGDFEKLLADNNIAKGEEFEFNGTVVSKEYVEAYDHYTGKEYEVPVYTLRDEATGIIFVKEISSDTAMDKYMVGENKFHFVGKIGYVNNFKRVVNFTGRLKKAKGEKNYVKAA